MPCVCARARVDTTLARAADGKVYIWHKQSSNLIAALASHVGPVNCVAWSPTDTGSFASAGDDNSIRLWNTGFAA